jgi:hypothetical protein
LSRTFSKYPFEAGYKTPSKSNTNVVFSFPHDDDDDFPPFEEEDVEV